MVYIRTLSNERKNSQETEGQKKKKKQTPQSMISSCRHEKITFKLLWDKQLKDEPLSLSLTKNVLSK